MTTILDAPGTNPANPFSSHIQAYLSETTPTPETVAAKIVTTVSDSSDPATALWQLWDAFFTVVTSRDSHQSLNLLLDAIIAQPAVQPTQALRTDANHALQSYTDADGQLRWNKLPRFSAQWRDVHDSLEASRGRDPHTGDISAEEPSSSDPMSLKYLRFCAFSAKLMAIKPYSEIAVHPINVFYACKNALECEIPVPSTGGNYPQDRMSPDHVRGLDILVAAIWLRDGGRALFEMSEGDLRQHWAAALEEETHYWPRRDGLTWRRWQLWAERLETLSVEIYPIKDPDTVFGEALKVVNALFKGSAQV